MTRQEDKARVEMYRNVFDSLPIGIMVLRLEAAGQAGSLRIVEVNPAGLRLSLAEGERAEGAMLRDFSPTIYATQLPGARRKNSTRVWWKAPSAVAILRRRRR